MIAQNSKLLKDLEDGAANNAAMSVKMQGMSIKE